MKVLLQVGCHKIALVILGPWTESHNVVVNMVFFIEEVPG
jgi:hypothetical protein